MPRQCTVRHCKLSSSNKNIPTFKFPDCEETKKKWKNAIGKANWSPRKYSSLCAQHFKDNDFTYHLSNTTKRLRLNRNAVPSLFLFPATNQNVEPTISVPDYIGNFEIFLNEFRERLDISSYLIFKNTDKIVFYKLENSDDIGCNITTRICISNNLCMKVIIRNTEVFSADLELPRNMRISKWSQISHILSKYREESYEIDGSREHFLNCALRHLIKARDTDEDFNHLGKLDILINQVELLNNNSPRYDSETIIFAFLIYAHSTATYNILRKFLILPHTRYLKHLSSRLHISPDYTTTSNDENYLNHISKSITDRDKYVALLIDEIYIEQGLQYKSNKIVGQAFNDPTECARTVMAFMIKSIYGNFKQIVRLFPVLRPTGETLFDLTRSVIQFVQGIDFKVVVIITDNNRINQNMFTRFCQENNWFINPDFPDMKIFYQYDTVHLFKNIRNNWLNLSNNNKTFFYPDFEDYSIKQASFSNFDSLYKSNSNSSVIRTKPYKLSHKTIHPNSLERQNVTLVNNLFHESTIAALYQYPEMKETADFCVIIRKWWNIVNTKGKFKGTFQRIETAQPIKSITDENFLFLEKFLIWLDVWNCSSNNSGTLTASTSNALKLTTQTIMDVIKFSLCQSNVDYVLIGKLQTDDLEGRFRLYRSLAGCSYRVSYTEVVECEKKIRLHDIVAHNKKDYKNMMQPTNENSLYEEVDLSDFEKILDNDYYLQNVKIDDDAQLYATGYAAHSASKAQECKSCQNLFLNDKGALTNSHYFNYLQRGGLSVASDETNYILFHMSAIFQEILRNSDLNVKFL